MRILTLYKPTTLRPTLFFLRTYHSAEHSGGGLMGIDSFSAQPSSKKIDPPFPLEPNISNPRTVTPPLLLYNLIQKNRLFNT